MAETEWGDLEAQFVTTLRQTKTEPVPPQIVALAQLSLQGQPHPKNPEQVMHAMQREFETEDRAKAFERHMRNAGPHTSPASSVTVIRDPERGKVQKVDEHGVPVEKDGKPVMVPGAPVNPRLVAWRAGAPRGRKPGQAS